MRELSFKELSYMEQVVLDLKKKGWSDEDIKSLKIGVSMGSAFFGGALIGISGFSGLARVFGIENAAFSWGLGGGFGLAAGMNVGFCVSGSCLKDDHVKSAKVKIAENKKIKEAALNSPEAKKYTKGAACGAINSQGRYLPSDISGVILNYVNDLIEMKKIDRRDGANLSQTCKAAYNGAKTFVEKYEDKKNKNNGDVVIEMGERSLLLR